jgi:hypothetical protein
LEFASPESSPNYKRSSCPRISSDRNFANIDKEKVYRHLKFTSLHRYAVTGLGLSDDRAYTYILVARKAAQVQKLQVALKNREITITKAKKVSPVINSKNADHWLELAKRVSQRALEGAVAKVNPSSSVQEGTRFISEKNMELKAVISIETEKKMKRVQDVLSQSKNKPMSFDETLMAAFQIFLEKKDPVVISDRIIKRKMRVEAKKHEKEALKTSIDFVKPKQNQRDNLNYKSWDGFSNENEIGRRIPLTANLKHQLNFRDRGQCREKNPDGTQCKAERWTDFHHIRPVSEGGLNIIENLITLCRSHHQMGHRSDR